MTRIDIVRIDIAGNDFIAVDFVMLQRLIDLFLKLIDPLIRYNNSLSLAVVDVAARCLSGETPFGKRA